MCEQGLIAPGSEKERTNLKGHSAYLLDAFADEGQVSAALLGPHRNRDAPRLAVLELVDAASAHIVR